MIKETSKTDQTCVGTSTTSCEQGVIIPLFLLLLPIVLLFISAALDLNRWAAIRRADEYFGQLSALKGLQVWMAQPDTDPYAARMNTVLTTVADRMGTNNFVGAMSFGPTFHASDPTQGAVLTPGYWYFNTAVIPAGSTRFVAADTTTGLVDLPPLVAGDPAPAPVPPNAMQVTGKISPDDANKPFLIHLFMQGMSQTSNIRVISAVVPRIETFLVDSTPNLTQTSHIPRTTPQQNSTPAQGYGSKFAFYLTADNPGASPNNDSQWNFLTTSTATLPNGGYTRSGSTPTLPAALAGLPIVHTWDDYRRTVLWNDSTYALLGSLPEATVLADPNDSTYAGALNLGTQERVYRIDHHSPQVGTGPVPLRNILAGIVTAVQTLKAEAVSGDLVCIILFDNTLAWTRTIPCTDKFDEVLATLDMAGATLANPDDAGTITPTSSAVVSASESPFRRAMRKNWFPNNNAFTDMQLAYNMAVKLINNGGGNLGITKNSITFITDGLNNVSYNNNNTTTATNTWANHVTSMTQLTSLVNSTAGITSTSVNTILIGDEVAPNTMMLRAPGDPWRCMTTEELRRNGIQETWSGTPSSYSETGFTGASPAAPYQHINTDMAALSQGTGGVFAPILRPSGGANCPTTPISASNPCPMTPTPLECDPDGRTQELQIKSAVNRIIGANPYTLVYVGSGNDPQP